jgi:hypothetical protein
VIRTLPGSEGDSEVIYQLAQLLKYPEAQLDILRHDDVVVNNDRLGFTFESEPLIVYDETITVENEKVRIDNKSQIPLFITKENFKHSLNSIV